MKNSSLQKTSNNVHFKTMARKTLNRRSTDTPKRKFNHLKLRDLRIFAGETQESLADKISCNRSAISRWEEDQKPGPRNLKKLAQFFGVPITVFFLTLFIFVNTAHAEINVEKWADAIYFVEGGDQTIYPYGIRSIKLFGDEKKARKICINTIKNNLKRWEKNSEGKTYLDFLADRYCPEETDPEGNINWKRNMKKILAL